MSVRRCERLWMEGSWTARVRGGASVGGMCAWPWLACMRGVAIVCLVGVCVGALPWCVCACGVAHVRG